MLSSLKALKKGSRLFKGIKRLFFLCLNAGDKTYYTFLNLKSADYLTSFEAFKHRYCNIANPTLSNI